MDYVYVFSVFGDQAQTTHVYIYMHVNYNLNTFSYY